MNLKDIPDSYRYEYSKDCELCGMTVLILSQEEGYLEFDTAVYVMCQCGEFSEFILPVN